MFGSPCSPCCGSCTPAKAYGLWQELRTKIVTINVSIANGESLPRRDAATLASTPYVHGQRATADMSGTPPPATWMANDGGWYVNSLESALTTGLDITGTKRVNGGHQYWEGHAEYSFGEHTLALDADPDVTSWNSTTNVGTVLFRFSDFRAIYQVHLTLHSRGTQSSAEMSYDGCALSASYSLQSFFKYAIDGEMSGSRFDVSFVELPHQAWAGKQTIDMAMATVSPQYYEKRTGSQRFLYLPTNSLRSYSGWWSSSQKPSSLPWSDSIDIQSGGALLPSESAVLSAGASPQVMSPTSQWLAHEDDGNWATQLNAVDGFFWNVPGQYGDYPVVTSQTPATQSYQSVLAVGTTIPLNITCEIA